MRRTLALALCLSLPGHLLAQGAYRTPPQAIVDCLDAPPPPNVSVSPSHQHLLLTARQSMPTIAVQAQPILRLAGLRIDAASRGPQRGARETGFTLVTIADGTQRPIAVPADADLGPPQWSADGSRFAFTNTRDDRIELWLADVATATARRIEGVQLVATLGAAVRWLPEQNALLCRLVAGDRPPPAPAPVPAGPDVQESRGVQAPVRTWQDLLSSPHDVELFEYYTTCQLAEVDAASGAIRKVGAPGIFADADASPDGRYLLVERVHAPYSYLHTVRDFPHEIAVWNRDGSLTAKIADVPLADGVPIGGVRTGPRGVEWLPTEDAQLLWLEALDGGDPKREVEHRDQLVRFSAPFSARPQPWLRTRHRARDVSFAAGGDLALVSEFDRDRRWLFVSRVDPHGDAELQPLFDRSLQDAYGDPGRPETTTTARGRRVLHQVGDALFLTGRGASPRGDRPFLDRWQLGSGDKNRLFQCADDRYEEVVDLLADDGSRVLVRRESRTEPPNWFVVDTTSGEARAVTELRDAAADLTAGITKTRLHYQRADGVALTGTLYLPPGHHDGQRLPLLVWAYPREYTSADDAGQVRGSTQRYTRLSGTSPLLLTLCGYAVLDDAAMPVIGPTETANDTFVEQLVADARAAIDHVVELGVADRDRVAIAGHSYGAFMTANLLAHSDLFRAGIARSGAYNRTLTPFGFQNERRTFWEAPQIYFAMSPFMHADKIDEPLLLIHGEADNNAGTFPIQSERLFHAIKGNGGTVRLVLLPHESHGYRARESVLHCLAEMVAWLDEHVKQAGPRAVEAAERSRK